ncbi:MAG TPA: sulfatase-like hydrolase/transferase [Armatimonadota bacterium]|nr:sulfatase-like hydrolase/transferase [Armatimonadota bacterium]
MSKPFQGIINIDVRDSQPDWKPYEPPEAPEGAPNVLYIVLDDVGFSAMSCYGGPIETPNIDKLAKNGVQYTQWHTTALCSPTRSCLLTGRNHTSNGMACIEECNTGFPNGNGHIPFENGLLSEILLERGYSTYALGKWHLCPEEEVNLSAVKRNWPLGRGFERFYGFLGGETSQWYPDLVYDNHPIEQPKLPEEGYHLTEDLVDHAIEFISDARQISPDKPFFMYFCPGATHAPHQVWREWADKYKGKFDMGYEQMREETLARQKEMGLVPPNTELPPMNPIGTSETRTSPDGKPFPQMDSTLPWDSLSDDEKRLFARMAEVYAGFLSHTDDQIGRLLQFLESEKQLDNTIVVLVSDNGASGEGGPFGSVNENKFFNGIPDDIKENMKMLGQLGSTSTYNHYCNGWAMAFDTPFKLWKRYSSYSGGTSDACIISWPNGMKARGELRHQYHHAIDIVPTVLECLDIEPPQVIKGYTQAPIEGTSMRYTFEDSQAPSHRTTQFYIMLGSRGIYHNGWKAMTTHPTLSGWGDFMKDTWELYHLEEDRAECHNLAEQEPEKLQELIAYWFNEAGKYNGLPIDDRSMIELLLAPRPLEAKPRNRYVYFPNTAAIPDILAADTRNRSFTIGSLVDITDPDVHGVIFANGTRFGGHTLFIKERRLYYIYNFVGMMEQKVISNTDIPTGDSIILSVSFDKQGENPPGIAYGTLTLYINDKAVGSATIKTQPGYFGIGSYITAGRSGLSTVTTEYEGPFTFTGGTLKRVVVDVTGEPYLDLEHKAEAALHRT